MEEIVAKFGPFIGILLELVLIGLGIMLIRKHTTSKQKAAECHTWPTVLGRISRSQVERKESSDEDGTTYSYTPRIEYVYQVMGQDYTSSQVVFGGFRGTGSSKKPQLVVNRYPFNSVVNVVYNPANPHEAVLEQTVGSGAIGALIGGVLLIVVSILMALPLLLDWLG